jgi:hypothetical protein
LAGNHLRPPRLAGQALMPTLYVPEETVSKGTVHAPAVPAILNDPFLNRGAAFTAAEREALGLAGLCRHEVLGLAKVAAEGLLALPDGPTPGRSVHQVLAQP